MQIGGYRKIGNLGIRGNTLTALQERWHLSYILEDEDRTRRYMSLR